MGKPQHFDLLVVLPREGRHTLRQLWDDGLPFEADLGLEAGHARRRILHAGGGATGQVLTSALLQRALDDPRIALFEYSPVAALTVDASDAVKGARVGATTFSARAVVLATGGYA